MEKYLIYILILLSLLIAIIVIVLLGFAFFFWRNYRQKEAPKKQIKDKVYRPARPEGYCSNHAQEKAVTICAICSKSLCEECASEGEGLYFCADHFQMYLEHDWAVITNEKTSPDNPTSGLIIYQFKDNLWDKEKIPSFIVTHYRINIESDFIESYVQLHVRKEEETILSAKLKGHLEGAPF